MPEQKGFSDQGFAHRGFARGVEFLNTHGINLVAVFPVANLPRDVCDVIIAEGITIEEHSSLVLMANGGRSFWDALQNFGMQTADPVDYFSHWLAKRFITDFLDSPPVVHLYPSAIRIPLQALGRLAGWSHPSPLGLGIHPAYGTWFAYRAAFLTSGELPATLPAPQPPACASCVDKPCIGACPADAVSAAEMLKLAACIEHRMSTESPCAMRCLAREACPVGREYRYSRGQIEYHGGRSLQSIRRHLQGAGATWR